MAPTERARLLARVADGMRELGDSLAIVETTDNGKLLRETRLQHQKLAATWDYYAGWPDKFHGSVLATDSVIHNYSRPEPVGVVAAIVPWNSPLLIATNKLAPALAAGNTVVVKPSEHTSASLLELVPVLQEAGLPPGVVNIITGLGETTGDMLVRHPGIDLISFTGGTATGKKIASRAAERPIRTILELGGKSPNIVFPDADFDNAAIGILAGIFAASGQTCIAGSRCFLHEEIYDDLLSRVVERTGVIRLGDPLADTTDMGPLAFREHMEHVLSHINLGRDEGATIRLGGRRSQNERLRDGFFVEPTILEGVTNDMRVGREEIFGPVLSVMSFRTEEEAVSLANHTPFGLAAGIWTRDLSRAHRLAQRIDAGTVWVNTYRAVSTLSPYGGFKESGYGKEGGEEAMREYSRLTSMSINF
jgi:aldehyde dehydrogenase (NAD+)